MKMIHGIEIPTRQSLPEDDYLILLGVALTVFNSNNSFVIEKILKLDSDKYNWYVLIERTSGQLKTEVKTVISKEASNEIKELFDELVDMRNRIIHSFQITKDEITEEQILATKVNETHEQYHIDREYLLNFIKMNQELSDKLYEI